MDWLGNIFISIAAFLGFGSQADMPPEPEPLPIETTIQEEATLPVNDAVVVDIPIVTEQAEEEEVESVSPEVEPEPLPEPDEEEVGAMIGNAPVDTSAVAAEAPLPPDIQTMIVAGGCFWCVEADLEKTNGVIEAVSGYGGGSSENPTYDDYGKGGHREIVEVTYDANVVSFEDILIVTMKTTDPTDDDGTFKDRGDKYSSAFFYETDEQKEIIDNLIAEVDQYGPYDTPLAIDVEPRPTFWPAEDFHQDYYKGTLTQIKYNYYRNASGRTQFIIDHWGVNDHSPELPWRTNQTSMNDQYPWQSYTKPSQDTLEAQLDPLAFKVTQKDGTERAGTSPLDKNWEDGIYVDILSGEPLFSSKDKFDSGTGWPSFDRPITADAVTEHEDRKLFSVRTEIRSAIADNHIGHVFGDGPSDTTGLRYCMNGVALEFVPKDEMAARGYANFLDKV